MKILQAFFILTSLLIPIISQANNKVIALTYDDLPAVGQKSYSSLEIMKKISTSLVKNSVQATGFISGSRIDGKQGKEALKFWAKSGLSLANHSWSHKHLSKSLSADYISDIERLEPILFKYNEKYGPWLKTFRFPYLDHGKSFTKASELTSYLTSTKTTLAHVSADTSDWAFADIYSRKIKTRGVKIKKLFFNLYLDHIEDCIKYSAEASLKVFGKPIPLVLLLHANELNADINNELIKRIVSMGYKFEDPQKTLASWPYSQFQYEIIHPNGGNIFEQIALKNGDSLPKDFDRTSYAYFKAYWLPKIEGIL